MRTLQFIIRCGNNIDDSVLALIKQIRQSLPDVQIAVIPDLLHNPLSGKTSTASLLGGSNFQFLPITMDWLIEQGLPYAGNRTGWMRGDFVFYRALELDWDYAWVIEPDVAFLNGAFEDFIEWCSEGEEDLLAVRASEHVSDTWTWKRRLLDTYDGFEKLGQMNFFFVRASRPLVEESQRHSIAMATNPRAHNPYQSPNDEIILASAAVSGGFSWKNLSDWKPKLFEFATTVHWTPIDALSKEVTEPKIIHKAMPAERITRKALETVREQAIHGLPSWKGFLRYGLVTADESILRQVLSAFVEGLPNLPQRAVSAAQLEALAHAWEVRGVDQPTEAYDHYLLAALVQPLVGQYPPAALTKIGFELLWTLHKLRLSNQFPKSGKTWIYKGQVLVLDLDYGDNKTISIDIERLGASASQSTTLDPHGVDYRLRIFARQDGRLGNIEKLVQALGISAPTSSTSTTNKFAHDAMSSASHARSSLEKASESHSDALMAESELSMANWQLTLSDENGLFVEFHNARLAPFFAHLEELVSRLDGYFA